MREFPKILRVQRHFATVPRCGTTLPLAWHVLSSRLQMYVPQRSEGPIPQFRFRISSTIVSIRGAEFRRFG
jgi:hypothetical protein